jgi:hypothetical protein
MKLKDLIEKLGLELKSKTDTLDRDVTIAYSSDILSDVMSHARDGCLWITLHTHRNIVSVGSLKSLAGIVLVNGRQPDDETLAKANEENVALMSTKMSTFEIVGKLYELGIRG